MSGRKHLPHLCLYALPLAVLLGAALFLACSDGRRDLGRPLQGGADAPAPAIPPPSPEADASLRLPDLRTTEPAELYIRYAAGRRQLRFSTTVENAGAGPVHVAGALGPTGISATATQIVERRQGDPLQRLLGRMNYDREHGHWHLDNFAAFELWTYRPGGGLETRLTSTPKITFCLLDMFKTDPGQLGVAQQPEFIECNWRRQGISEGWSEVYPAQLPGQELDITGIPDGRYALRTVLDPEGQFLEADTSNNTSTVYVELAGGRVSLLETP